MLVFALDSCGVTSCNGFYLGGSFLFLITLGFSLFVIFRLNDIGWSCFLAILFFIPYVSFIFLLVLCVYPGKKTERVLSISKQSKTDDTQMTVTQIIKERGWIRTLIWSVLFFFIIIPLFELLFTGLLKFL